ncbi:MAG: hypothetical protein ACREQ5_31215, partial [Candidatus Dormibacteria bacterium]
ASLIGVALPSTGGNTIPQVRGPIARPDPGKTPGAIAVHDVSAVCRLPRHIHNRIPVPEQKAVFNAYGLQYPGMTSKYALDYLVPIPLGGAPVAANLWPAESQKGVGFHQKEQLNAKLRVMVCEGRIPLATVQQQIVTDWYSLWYQYVANPASTDPPSAPSGLGG